jgi:hypothetical protein
MTGRSEQVNSYYFDLETGLVIVNDGQIIASAEAGALPKNLLQLHQLGRLALNTEIGHVLNDTDNKNRVLRLGDLISDLTIVLIPGAYRELDVSSWDMHDDYIPYGRWLSMILGKREGRRQLNRDDLNRAYLLGVGPHSRRISRRSRFGSLGNYYEACEFTDTHRAGKYSDWIKADYVAYARNVAAELGRRPSEDQLYDLISKGLDGPSPHVMSSSGYGTFGDIFEIAGYPNVRKWDDDDFIDWGVKFMLANNGHIPTSAKFRKLSEQNKHRGPSLRAVIDHFDKLSIFQQRVQIAYDARIEKIEYERDYKLWKIGEAVESGALPTYIAEETDSEVEQISLAARYLVIKKLLPQATEVMIRDAVKTVHVDSFVKAIQRIDPAIKRGEIEVTAVQLDVFDDIWPMDDYMQYLKIDS